MRRTAVCTSRGASISRICSAKSTKTDEDWYSVVIILHHQLRAASINSAEKGPESNRWTTGSHRRSAETTSRYSAAKAPPDNLAVTVRCFGASTARLRRSIRAAVLARDEAHPRQSRSLRVLPHRFRNGRRRSLQHPALVVVGRPVRRMASPNNCCSLWSRPPPFRRRCRRPRPTIAPAPGRTGDTGAE
jgi:hypothetical protein